MEVETNVKTSKRQERNKMTLVICFVRLDFILYTLFKLVSNYSFINLALVYLIFKI